ncbi:MAG: GC-type dockerin domain-anchored protein [Planctomycetota bacterium]
MSTVFTIALLAGTAGAQVHEGDISLGVDGGQLAVGDGSRFDDGSLDFAASVFGAGLDAFARTTNPGIDTDFDTFAPGTQVGYEYTAALRKWDGEDFDTIPAERVRMSLGPNPGVSTPLTDETVLGVTKGANSVGEWHTHYAIRLELNGSPANTAVSDGVYLLTLRLFEASGSIEHSDDFAIVLDNGTNEVEFEEALAAAEGLFTDTPFCQADVNGDGKLLADDYSAWLLAFLAGDAKADQNGDGKFLADDFNAWLLAFLAGC